MLTEVLSHVWEQYSLHLQILGQQKLIGKPWKENLTVSRREKPTDSLMSDHTVDTSVWTEKVPACSDSLLLPKSRWL